MEGRITRVPSPGFDAGEGGETLQEVLMNECAGAERGMSDSAALSNRCQDLRFAGKDAARRAIHAVKLDDAIDAAVLKNS
jgi:hypothetical protein